MDYKGVEDEESDILSSFFHRLKSAKSSLSKEQRQASLGLSLQDSDFLALCSHTTLLLKGMSSKEHGKNDSSVPL